MKEEQLLRAACKRWVEIVAMQGLLILWLYLVLHLISAMEGGGERGPVQPSKDYFSI